jgi:hypothetical protein
MCQDHQQNKMIEQADPEQRAASNEPVLPSPGWGLLQLRRPVSDGSNERESCEMGVMV